MEGIVGNLSPVIEDFPNLLPTVISLSSFFLSSAFFSRASLILFYIWPKLLSEVDLSCYSLRTVRWVIYWSNSGNLERGLREWKPLRLTLFLALFFWGILKALKVLLEVNFVLSTDWYTLETIICYLRSFSMWGYFTRLLLPAIRVTSPTGDRWPIYLTVNWLREDEIFWF